MEPAALLNDERRHLTREDRAAWVRKFHEQGMSQRVIADAVGAGTMTVNRRLNGNQLSARRLRFHDDGTGGGLAWSA
ncbi:hypothetical protein [Gemmata sp.]|uniref:hypothetical protein n=1 Tax=Gemmata sp. TaxID=1914242 RepID=UPI003F715065